MALLFFGFSHLTCMQRAYGVADFHGAECRFFPLRQTKEAPGGEGPKALQSFDLGRIATIVRDSDPSDAVCLSIRGNEHAVVSLLDLGLSRSAIESQIASKVRSSAFPWLEFFAGLGRPVVVIPPPPPLPEEHIREFPSQFEEKLQSTRVSPAAVRLAAWNYQVGLLRAKCDELKLQVFEYPASVYGDDGLLLPDLGGDDPTHGNTHLGAIVLAEMARLLPEAAKRQDVHDARSATTRSHPYRDLPETAFWRESVSSVPAEDLDPVSTPAVRISKADKVATAGSCFAQHISKRLRKGGFQFLVTEHPAPAVGGDAAQRGFYDFSARYGNVYTSRQLVQLFDRAFGYFRPLEDHWVLQNGRCCDPFRPRIEPGGFATVDALREDRERHLAAVKEMFEQLDVFVFTLGLTECWMSKLDGAAYPLAPGVAGGQYDPARHAFRNLSVDDIRADLNAFIGKLRLVNPRARVILTVSPVPLAATYAEEHVLVATTYSKSVLRVAAEMVERAHPGVFYFPSYEIITGAYARGKYFAEDLREVTEEGVSHVMRVFMDRMITDAPDASLDDQLAEMERLAEAVCDEVLLGNR